VARPVTGFLCSASISTSSSNVKRNMTMAIPDFQSIMLPLLKLCSDGKEHTNREAIETLSREFRLSPEEQKQLLPSGKQRIFDNRVAWARAYMKMALLLENNRRGVFRITARGRQVLGEAPEAINLAYLRRFPEYLATRSSQQNHQEADASTSAYDVQENGTPRERLEEAYMVLRDSLAEELLVQLKSSPPSFFEKIVVDVLVKMGYGGSIKDAGQAIGGSGDEGIDGTIKEDRLGLDIIYIQAKRWETTVSRPEIQKFAGALQGKRARKGIFITTSDFSKSAHEFVLAIDNKIILIDGKQLVGFMIDFGVGVATDVVYELKRLDSDYFEES
jgi:restriction system protein